MWRKKSYFAIMTDCHMPEMDGFELARQIRQEETKGARIPIIAIAADAISGTKKQCAEAGMDSYVLKPVRLDALKASLSGLS